MAHRQMSQAELDKIFHLLDTTELSNLEISRQLGWSPPVISDCKTGRTSRVYNPRKRGPKFKHRPDDPIAALGVSAYPSRCPTCGGMVKMPCTECGIQAILRSRDT